MKKIIKICLFTFITVVSFGLVNVKAAGLTVNSSVSGTVDPDSKLVTNVGTIEFDISNVDTGTDVFSAYKIIDVFYNSITNVVTYEFTSNFKSFLAQSENYKNLTVDQYMALTSGSLTSGSTVTNSTLDKLASEYAGYIRSKNIVPDETGFDLIVSVYAGAYLILPVSTMKVYAVMVANVVPYASTRTSEWNVNNVIIVPKVSEVGVTKSVSAIGTVSASYGFTDTFKYYIVATVPVYPTNAVKTTYALFDKINAGLSFVNDITNIIIYDGETKLTTKSDGTVVDAAGNVVALISLEVPDSTTRLAVGNGRLDIEFDTKYITSNKLTVEYTAKLNSKANLGSVGNKNSVTLFYNNDPYSSISSDEHITVETTVYTYGIDLLVYKNGDKTTVINGTEFDVYKDSGLTQKVGTITTDSSGKGTLAGVAEGTYYLKQTKTASGYGLANTTSMKVKITGSVASDTEGYYKVEIPLSSSGLLPYTGGVGTIIYSLIGLLIIGGGVLGFVLYNKKMN